MDHMRILGIEPSSVILSQIKNFPNVFEACDIYNPVSAVLK